MSPSDGRVLHFGRVHSKQVEQVKGVTYSLDTFLGPGIQDWKAQAGAILTSNAGDDDEIVARQKTGTSSVASKDKDLYHIVIYLAPGDCHHFHSPTHWNAHTRRHFPGQWESFNRPVTSQ